jgi:AcrR family transcriptional regulator
VSLETSKRVRLPAEERRALIISAARALFARNGFHATGTNEIAAAAGCSEPIIYRHFASKQALFGAALEDATAQVREHIAGLPAVDGESVFDAYIRSMRDLISDPLFVEVSRLRISAMAMADDPEIRAALQHVSALHRERTREIVRAGKQDGSIRNDVDDSMVAMVLFGFALSSSYKLAVSGERSLAGFPAMLEAFVSLIRPHTAEESANA